MQQKMIVQERLQEIDAKIKAFQTKKKKMIETRKVQLSNFLTLLLDASCANTLSQEVLTGALIEAVEKFENKEAIIKVWQVKGEELLSQLRGKKSKRPFRQSDKKDQPDSAKDS